MFILCLLVGTPMLCRLQRNGERLCSGALIGLVGGLIGSMTINDAAQTHLGDAMKLTYEIWVTSAARPWGCALPLALPLLNMRARLALHPRVELHHEDE